MAFNPWKDETFNEKRKRILDSMLTPKQALVSIIFILIILFGGFLVIPFTFFHGAMDWFFLILYAIILTGAALIIGKKIELYDEKEDA